VDGGLFDRNDRGSCQVVLVSVVLNCELLAVRNRVLFRIFNVLNELSETNSCTDDLLFSDLILCAVKQHGECMSMLHMKNT
jgi:hypothetical protein